MKKKNILLIIILLSTVLLKAQDSSSFMSFPVKNWNVKLVGLKNYYPAYLADPLGIRFEVSSQRMLYSDFDFSDEVNKDGTYLGKLVINPGVRISLFKFSPASNPDLGIEIDLGLTIPTFMRSGNHDVVGMDGIYYFAIAGRPAEWLSLRFSKHHICTHVGDEYPSGGVESPVDYDPNVTQLPVRDDFIFSAAVNPLHLLGYPDYDILMVYGDLGFFMPGSDFMGSRQNKPHRNAYMNYQGGAEIEYYFRNEYFGGVFAAYNVSAYQTNSFAPNHSVVAGYIFPQERNKRRLRIGINYYNGRSWSNQFYNRKEKSIGFIVAMDI